MHDVLGSGEQLLKLGGLQFQQCLQFCQSLLKLAGDVRGHRPATRVVIAAPSVASELRERARKQQHAHRKHDEHRREFRNPLFH